MNEYLNSILISSMLKTSNKNCLEMYKKVNLDVMQMLEIMENVVASYAFYNYISATMAINIHLIYENLLNDYPECRIDITESYNYVKGELNTHALDNNDTIIFDDILRRELGVYHDNFHLYTNTQMHYYTKRYDEVMDDIAVDGELINYLNHNDYVLDNDLCKSSSFLKSIRYIIYSLSDEMDILTQMKLIQTLKYRESLFENSFMDKIKTKIETNKLIKRLGGIHVVKYK